MIKEIHDNLQTIRQVAISMTAAILSGDKETAKDCLDYLSNYKAKKRQVVEKMLRGEEFEVSDDKNDLENIFEELIK